LREEVFVLCAVGVDAHIRPCVFPTAAKRAMRFVGTGLRARPLALPNICGGVFKNLAEAWLSFLVERKSPKKHIKGKPKVSKLGFPLKSLSLNLFAPSAVALLAQKLDGTLFPMTA